MRAQNPVPGIPAPPGGAASLRGPAARNLLAALAVAGGGFVLLNLAFGFVALTALGLERMVPSLRMGVGVGIALGIIAVASVFVLRSELRPLYKAMLATVPLACFYVVLGVAFFEAPWVTYAVGGIATAGLVAWLLLTGRPWIYVYTVLLVAAALTIFTLLGGEI